MKIYGLSGKSGTGKSYQSLSVCKERDIVAIIDDGLLISENKICAGKSAKREANMVSAIKRAIFSDEEHRKHVSEYIKKAKFESLLIIGTSDRMILQIAEKLELGEVNEIIQINDITTVKEREIARKQRLEHGKHIIPVSSFQLKKDFSGYFMDSLKMLKKLTSGKQIMTEKSVVRPTFSYLGKYIIAEKVLNDITSFIVEKNFGVAYMIKASFDNLEDGIIINVDVQGKKGVNLIEICKQMQKDILEKIEFITAFNVIAVNIVVKGIE